MSTENFIRVLKNKQIIAYAVAGIILTTAMLWLFGTSNNDNLSAIETELSDIAQNIRNHYKHKPDYWGLNTEVALNIAPSHMVRNGKIVSAIGREFIVGQNENGDTIMPSQRSFTISITNLPKKVCEGLATLKISHENNYSLQKIRIISSSSKTDFEWGGNNVLPISSEDAVKFCDKKNSISWVFE